MDVIEKQPDEMIGSYHGRRIGGSRVFFRSSIRFGNGGAGDCFAVRFLDREL